MGTLPARHSTRPRRDPRLPYLRRLARIGLNAEQLRRAAGLPLVNLREVVEWWVGQVQ